MSFDDRVNDLVADFYKENLIKPNELWVGYDEQIQLEIFINSLSEKTFENKERIYIDDRTKFEFMGLKIRTKNTLTYLSVEYNQYY